MILGNKFLRVDKSIAFKAADILSLLSHEAKDINEIISILNMSFIDCLQCLDFLYSIGYIEKDRRKICLKK